MHATRSTGGRDLESTPIDLVSPGYVAWRHVALALTQPWLGSEIAADMIDLKTFSVDLLDDKKPLKSYVEAVEDKMFTPAASMACMAGD